MRPIDADDLDTEIVACSAINQAYFDGHHQPVMSRLVKTVYEMIREKIKNAPTVDAVPVIRCKDCRFRDSELACTQFDAYTSAAGDLFMPSDWFYCGYGKRKEE